MSIAIDNTMYENGSRAGRRRGERPLAQAQHAAPLKGNRKGYFHSNGLVERPLREARRPGNGKALIIAGTDTGVGKTLVCGGLAAVLARRGIGVGVMKPVESGCRARNGRLVPEDAMMLRRMAGSGDELSLVNPYPLSAPLAPALAARTEKVEIRLEVVTQALSSLLARHELVLVEGAGGMLSPLAPSWSLPRLALELRCPMLLVARNALGAINHCLLSLYYARQEGIPVLGVILNQVAPKAGQAEDLNPGAVEEWGSVQVLGTVPQLVRPTAHRIAAAVRENIDCRPIIAWLRS